MKKFTVISVVIMLAILFSMLPMGSALALKGREPSNINVRNRSGGVVTMTLTSAAGSQVYTLPTGTFDLSVAPGVYTYVATSPCAQKSGTLNMTRKARLYFSCAADETVKLSPIAAPVPAHLPR